MLIAAPPPNASTAPFNWLTLTASVALVPALMFANVVGLIVPSAFCIEAITSVASIAVPVPSLLSKKLLPTLYTLVPSALV